MSSTCLSTFINSLVIATDTLEIKTKFKHIYLCIKSRRALKIKIQKAREDWTNFQSTVQSQCLLFPGIKNTTLDHFQSSYHQAGQLKHSTISFLSVSFKWGNLFQLFYTWLTCKQFLGINRTVVHSLTLNLFYYLVWL